MCNTSNFQLVDLSLRTVTDLQLMIGHFRKVVAKKFHQLNAFQFEESSPTDVRVFGVRVATLEAITEVVFKGVLFSPVE